jgi:DNA-directed RNA polymerase subunit RPC12/RpoP
MKKQTQKSAKKTLLVSALSGDLDKMAKSPWVRSMKDGKNLICPYCAQSTQPCKSDSSAMCEHMLLDGTFGKELEDALKNPESSRFGKCINCGSQIPLSLLKKNPTADVCPQCAKKSQKIRASKVA